MSDYKTFQVKDIGPVVEIIPQETEILQRSMINALADELLDYVKSERPAMLLVTLKEVARFSSENIGGLVKVQRWLRANEGEMKLCMDDTLRQLFRIARLDGTIFDIHDSVNKAVAAFFDK